VSFDVLQAPYVLYTAVVSIRRFSSPTGPLMIFKLLAVLLLALKSAVNFIVYCWFSENCPDPQYALYKFAIPLLAYSQCCCISSSRKAMKHGLDTKE